MDLLQRELARKKALFSKASSSMADGHPEDESSGNLTTKKRKKYLKNSELRRLEEEEEEEERERLKRQKQQQNLQKDKGKNSANTLEVPPSSDASAGNKARKEKKKTKTKTKSSDEALDHDDNFAAVGNSSDDSVSTSPQLVTLQLRALGLPIRFFGETASQRLNRLQEALAIQNLTLQGLSEMEEFRLGQGHGIRNPFLGRDKNQNSQTNDGETNDANDAPGNNNTNNTNKVTSKNGKDQRTSERKDEEKDDDQDQDDPRDDNDDDSDPPKRIYKFLKGLLKDWEADLEARPTSVAKSVAGQTESKTLKQCKDYIRPLFKQLKRRKLEPGMQTNLTKIVEFAQQGEFVKAHDAYMDVAIGRAAWPIGVTMVGIHARSGRAKIESSNVAHVMNSELQRKYLTSVKRLLSYAQKKRPDIDPSKKVS